MVGLILWMIGIVSPEALMFIMQSDYRWIVFALLVVDLLRLILEGRGDK